MIFSIKNKITKKNKKIAPKFQIIEKSIIN